MCQAGEQWNSTPKCLIISTALVIFHFIHTSVVFWIKSKIKETNKHFFLLCEQFAGTETDGEASADSGATSGSLRQLRP